MMKTRLKLLRSIRSHTLALVQGLSQEQIDFSPPSGEWSLGESVDHLLLAEQIFRAEIAALIELAKAGKKPRLYRSFADLNVGPSFIPKSILPFLEIPFAVLTTFTPSCVREFMPRLMPIRHPDVSTPHQGRPADELRAELHTSLAETEALLVANPDFDYDKMIHQHPLC